MNRLAKAAYGDLQIEDLWLNYFCVSSNLTTTETMVHRQGTLWKAVRISGSLPGILPPWLQDNHLLVDGGVLNNLPGDVMQGICRGIVILVDVSAKEHKTVACDKFPSPWSTVWGKFLPGSKPSRNIPGMLDVVMRSTVLGSANRIRTIKNNADYYFNPPVNEFGLLAFDQLNRIAEAGYLYAGEKIQELKKHHQRFPFG